MPGHTRPHDQHSHHAQTSSTSPHIRLESGDEVSRHLAAADAELGALIEQVGCVDLGPLGDPFEVIARSIASQQLSSASAESIFRRMEEQIGATPEAIAGADPDAMRAIGLSGRKAEYLQGIARDVVSGELDLEAMREMDDDAITERLLGVRGIGPWTVHMFLLFSLGRLDVLADGDLGTRTAAGEALGLGRPATSKELVDRSERWRPYRSAAMFYLWASRGAPIACEPDA